MLDDAKHMIPDRGWGVGSGARTVLDLESRRRAKTTTHRAGGKRHTEAET